MSSGTARKNTSPPSLRSKTGFTADTYDRRQAASLAQKVHALVAMTGIGEADATEALTKAGLDLRLAYAALTGKAATTEPARRIRVMVEVDLDPGPAFHPDHLVHKIQHAIQVQRDNVGITRESDEETDILAVNVRLHDNQTYAR